jgi:formylglycine-generating enzyme required for sulfatase activity
MARKACLAAVVALIGLLCGAGLRGDDKSLDWVNKHLADGNCSVAKINYEGYKNGGGSRNAEAERLLKECEEKEAAKAGGANFMESDYGFEMVYVAAGTFTMGCKDGRDKDCSSTEKPAHPVTLTKDFYIGKTEVTQEQWKAVMGSNLYYFEGNNLPVAASWDDAQKFVEKLNAATGKKYRLPTEAEWEYAARGGSRSKGYLYSGSNTAGDVAWYNDNSAGKKHAVGAKRPNELGIYDMSGHVWEWCQDWYADKYSGNPQTDPEGPGTGASRVYRGGSWNNNTWFPRVAYRGSSDPGKRYSNVGFRLAISSK